MRNRTDLRKTTTTSTENTFIRLSLFQRRMETFITFNNGVHMNINEDGIFMDKGFRV